MRRLISILAAVFTMCAAAFALPTSSILLQHEGNVTVIPADSLSVALDKAVDGDTILLSKGSFPGFTIDKQITVRGEGQETVVNGDIIVAIPGNPRLSQTLIEGLKVDNINFNLPVNGIRVRQCSFIGLETNDTNETEFYDDILIDRCCTATGYVSYINFSSNCRNVKVVNSSILRALYSGEKLKNSIVFVNCNIRSPYEDGGAYVNCIIGYYSRYSGNREETHRFYNATFQNTLLTSYKTSIDTETCQVINSWVDDDRELLLSYYACKYSTEELEQKGYIGNDGTVVGNNGGAAPYTLTLAVPTVEESDIKLDAEKRVLNVNVKLKSN